MIADKHFYAAFGLSVPEFYRREVKKYISRKLSKKEIEAHKEYYHDGYEKLWGQKWDESTWEETSKNYFWNRKKLPYVENPKSEEIKYVELR